MERLEFEFTGNAAAVRALRPVLVGVVGSGNLEVLIEPEIRGGGCHVTVDTAVHGFGDTWRSVLADFFERHALRDVKISINDGGATPAVVMLRLDQAAHELRGAAI